MFSYRIDGSTLYLEGHLDAHNAHALCDILDKFNSNEVVINLAGVSFLSSATLVEFLTFSRRLASQGGRLVLAAPNAAIRSVFAVTGFDRIFTIKD